MTTDFLGLSWGFGSDDDLANSINDELERQRLIDDINKAVSSTLGNKIFTATNSINNSISNTTSQLGGKIFTSTSSINSNVDAEAAFTRNKINSLGVYLNNEIDNSTNKLYDSVKSSTSLISNRITNQTRELSTTISNILGSDDDLLQNQNNILKFYLAHIADTIEKSSANMSTEIAQELDLQGFISELTNTIQEQQLQTSNSIGDIFAPLARMFGFLPSENESNQAVRGLGDIFYKLTRNEYATLDEVRQDLDSRFSGNFLLAWVLKMLIFGSTLFGISHSIGRPFALNIEKLAAATATPNELSAENLLSLMVSDRLSEDDYYARMKEIGYNRDNAEKFSRLGHQTYSLSEIRQLHFREMEQPREIKRLIGALGYNEHQTTQILELFEVQPTPSDIVRFAVKDVYDEDVVSEFGLDDELKQTYLDDAAKIGMTEDLARKYWRSSWTLPSLTQGYEMFHRSEINEAQLDQLFKAADIVPFWREKLLKINYSPYTRVDARRMHKLGVLDDDELLRAYKDIGYDDEKASKMVQWTIEYNNLGGDDNIQSNRDLTRSLIIKAYKLGVSNLTDTKVQLMQLGYSDENAQTILDIADIETGIDLIPEQQKDNARKIERILAYGITNAILSEDDFITEYVNLGYTNEQAQEELNYLNWEKFITVRELLTQQVKEQYVKYIIDENNARSILAANNFGNEEINEVISLWDIERDNRTRVPTKTDLDKFISKGIIDISEYIQYMRANGYADNTIFYYLSEIYS